ncbi:MAG: methionyl-tRNA formyltransferase [Clostridia bacterium]|nr:methionyl-tRNA formyltransferase [Clostridia bacterium]
MNLKILFMGTPDIARDSLKAIYETKNEIIGVVTNPDKQKGRGMKFIYSPVKEFAIENNLKLFQPEKVKNNIEFIGMIKRMNPDLICVVAYGKILPSEILNIPRLGCINLHASLLPKYRGAAPIQWAVINGDRKTGVTTMYMDVGMDTGDIIFSKEIQIGEYETTGELWDRISNDGAELLIETIDRIERGDAPRVKQPSNFTMAPMIDKSLSKIDWKNKNVMQIKNLIRGLNPIMGAYTVINDNKIKIWRAKIIENGEFLKNEKVLKEKGILKHDFSLEKIEVGNIVIADSKYGLLIKAKDGIIEAQEVQGENAKKMSASEFLRGKGSLLCKK